MRWSTTSRRRAAASGCARGVVAAGRGDHAGQQGRLLDVELRGAGALAGLPAAGVLAAEVRLRGRLDPVGAVAEVDRVEVVAQDPLLGPLARDLEGERGLAQLLEHGAVVLRGQRVLDELLGDRRAALDDALLDQVLVERAGDAAEVDAVVRVEAAVLDGDDRLLHDGRDVRRGDEDPPLAAGQEPEAPAVAVDQHGVADGRVLELRQVGRDGHHHPEDRRDDGEHAEPEEDREHAQLADADVPARRPAVAVPRARGGGRQRRGPAVAAARAGTGAARRVSGGSGDRAQEPRRRAVAAVGGTGSRGRVGGEVLGGRLGRRYVAL
jgi:hypothetical protein